MSTSFTVSLIEAKSDVPLYLYNVSGGGRKVVTTAWQTLWTAPNTTSDSFAAFDLSLPSSTVIGLRLTCTFGSSFSGKTLEIQGLLNGTLVTSSPVTVTSTGPIVVQKFVQSSQRGSPVSYRGLFQWRLRDGSTTVATFGTQTSLELYTVVSPPAALWPSVGISVNLLRAYVAVWNSTVSSWALADFYRYVAQTIFGGPFKYDNQYGAPRYTGDLGGPYALDQYFRDLASTGAASITINCYDMAGIVQVVLSLFANYSQVRWNYMKPYGWINTTT
jgi:hypothetical protein